MEIKDKIEIECISTLSTKNFEIPNLIHSAFEHHYADVTDENENV